MTTMTRGIRTVPDLESLSEAASREIVEIARSAIAARGRFTLALAGGSTPKRTYELLSTRYRGDVDWGRTVIVFGDERLVPADDPRSNYKMAREALLDRVPIPAANVHPVPTEGPSAAEAAERYDATLRRALGEAGPPTGPNGATVDVALLGVGPDGHTASLFPNTPELAEESRWALPVEAPTHGVQPVVPRVTTTLPFLARARTAIFLVAGADKRGVLGEILHDTPAGHRYPAAMVAPNGPAIWMIDRSALPDDRSNA